MAAFFPFLSSAKNLSKCGTRAAMDANQAPKKQNAPPAFTSGALREAKRICSNLPEPGHFGVNILEYTTFSDAEAASAKRFLDDINSSISPKAIHPVVINVDNVIAPFPILFSRFLKLNHMQVYRYHYPTKDVTKWPPKRGWENSQTFRLFLHLACL